MFAFDRITAGYDETVVLRDVSLAVPPASAVALVGANGAGKTTLMRVALGLLRPRRGRVVLDGADITGWSADRTTAAGVCLIRDVPGIFPSLTVAENLTMFAGSSGRPERWEPAFEALPRLRGLLPRRAGTLSGGEQQALALARAYIQPPKVILLDEVSTGLAPALVDDIFALIGQLRTTGVALLLVEQYVTRALAVADYVYVLNRGRVTFAGEPAEVDTAAMLSWYLGFEEGPG